MVSDAERVYKHMLNARIGTSKAQLYLDWSLLLEKYQRDFEAASLVYLEGLKRVSGDQDEKILLAKYTGFEKRMQLRIDRDVKDPLGVQRNTNIKSVINTEADHVPVKTNSKKRKYAEVFGN